LSNENFKPQSSILSVDDQIGVIVWNVTGAREASNGGKQ